MSQKVVSTQVQGFIWLHGNASGNLIVTLLDENGKVLEQRQSYQPKTRSVNQGIISLIGEESETLSFTFGQAGSRVTATYGPMVLGEDNANLSALTFEGISARLSDFVSNGKNGYSYTVQTANASTLVSFLSENPEASVTINGKPVTGSTTVPIGATGSTDITVAVTSKDTKNTNTYVLHVQSTNSAGGSPAGGNTASGSANYALRFETNGGTTISEVTAKSGSIVNLSAYKPSKNGYSFGGWYSDKELTKIINSITLTANTTIYAKWTKGLSFTDVPNNAYFKAAVDWAVAKGVTDGTTPTTFSPELVCTRAQAVTLLWRAMGSPDPTDTNNPFTDVSADAYYYNAARWAVENGITAGTSATTFSPDDNCSRAQIVTLQHRAAGSPATGTINPFTDVASGAYYANAVLWAAKENITQGTTTTIFSPNADCTRAQIVTFLFRYLSR